MPIQRQIRVTFQREGIHCYPAAKTDPRLADVSFLSNPHRHIFHFTVTISVDHNDRDIEFVLFKRRLEALYDNGVLDLSYQSCEMLAETLLRRISDWYLGTRSVSVEVSEDGENGAILTINHTQQLKEENAPCLGCESFLVKCPNCPLS